jgi:hypothetical protein
VLHADIYHQRLSLSLAVIQSVAVIQIDDQNRDPTGVTQRAENKCDHELLCVCVFTSARNQAVAKKCLSVEIINFHRPNNGTAAHQEDKRVIFFCQSQLFTRALLLNPGYHK